MFGPPDDSDITLEEDRIQNIPQVTQEDNEMLTNEFTEAEVKSVVFQMEHNKAPGPDGFPAEFYQVFWEVIKDDLMALLRTSITRI